MLAPGSRRSAAGTNADWRAPGRKSGSLSWLRSARSPSGIRDNRRTALSRLSGWSERFVIDPSIVTVSLSAASRGPRPVSSTSAGERSSSTGGTGVALASALAEATPNDTSRTASAAAPALRCERGRAPLRDRGRDADRDHPGGWLTRGGRAGRAPARPGAARRRTRGGLTSRPVAPKPPRPPRHRRPRARRRRRR